MVVIVKLRERDVESFGSALQSAGILIDTRYGTGGVLTVGVHAYIRCQVSGEHLTWLRQHPDTLDLEENVKLGLHEGEER